MDKKIPATSTPSAGLMLKGKPPGTRAIFLVLVVFTVFFRRRWMRLRLQNLPSIRAGGHDDGSLHKLPMCGRFFLLSRFSWISGHPWFFPKSLKFAYGMHGANLTENWKPELVHWWTWKSVNWNRTMPIDPSQHQDSGHYLGEHEFFNCQWIVAKHQMPDFRGIQQILGKGRTSKNNKFRS